MHSRGTGRPSTFLPLNLSRVCTIHSSFEISVIKMVNSLSIHRSSNNPARSPHRRCISIPQTRTAHALESRNQNYTLPSVRCEFRRRLICHQTRPQQQHPPHHRSCRQGLPLRGNASGSRQRRHSHRLPQRHRRNNKSDPRASQGWKLR
jgi:hypothetical protein